MIKKIFVMQLRLFEKNGKIHYEYKIENKR